MRELRPDYAECLAQMRFDKAVQPWIEADKPNMTGPKVKLRNGRWIGSEKAGYSMPVDRRGIKSEKRLLKEKKVIFLVALDMLLHSGYNPHNKNIVTSHISATKQIRAEIVKVARKKIDRKLDKNRKNVVEEDNKSVKLVSRIKTKQSRNLSNGNG